MAERWNSAQISLLRTYSTRAKFGLSFALLELNAKTDCNHFSHHITLIVTGFHFTMYGGERVCDKWVRNLFLCHREHEVCR